MKSKSLTAVQLISTLENLGACSKALFWCEGKTARQAWLQCPRGDWLLWIAQHRRADRKLLVSAACACARLALPFVPTWEARPRKAIEAAEGWTQGDASLDEMYQAAANARDAICAPSALAAVYAACAAGSAADAACGADVSCAAVYAAYARFHATNDAAARRAMQKQCADVVRKLIPLRSLYA